MPLDMTGIHLSVTTDLVNLERTEIASHLAGMLVTIVVHPLLVTAWWSFSIAQVLVNPAMEEDICHLAAAVTVAMKQLKTCSLYFGLFVGSRSQNQNNK